MGANLVAINRQISLVPEPDFSWAAAPAANYGEVFTRPWVVNFILDLVGYRPEVELAERRIVEPSCGTGAFLVPLIHRLIASCDSHGQDIADAADAIQAFDLLAPNVALARKAAAVALEDHGVPHRIADRLARGWINQGDFLLREHEPASADFVVGNPPYIRLEGVPESLTNAYRRNCPTMKGRSDIYVGFFETGLDLLRPDGVLGFICADRWMHNQYGAALRAYVTSRFSVDAIVRMHDVDAFEDDVSAYPAVTILRAGKQQAAHVVDTKKDFDADAAGTVTRWISGATRRRPTSRAFEASKVAGWFGGGELWPSGSPKQLSLLAELEQRCPPLQDERTGTRVGIGVATGCDDVFITDNANLVEEDRLLPLVMAAQLGEGTPNWAGTYLVNPWDGRGLVDLRRYPKLRRYLDANQDRVRARHTAQKNPQRWYRTIDSVDPALQRRPKLLLPDIKAAAHPVLERGEYYPHHNLYYVVSDTWDLEVLGGLLLSDIANLFVGAYCVKMRGGTYRFQAQYLRKIRVPDAASLTEGTAQELRTAFRVRSTEAATRAAAAAYCL